MVSTLESSICLQFDRIDIGHAPAHTLPKHNLSVLLERCIHQMQDTLLADLVAASTPLLTDLAQYYARKPSKYLRPRLIFLMALATNGLGESCDMEGSMFSQSGILSDSALGSILPQQVRLAEIIEMIHVASLLHDDVMDESQLRRGALSAPSAFDNKKTVLAGDFLLGRAMVLCAALGSSEVMALVAGIIATLVEGELRQAQDAMLPLRVVHGVDEYWKSYLEKTYMKTASMFSNALRAAVVLGGPSNSQPWMSAAAAYGRELGMAFQIMDDVLDYQTAEDTGNSVGKPIGGADLRLGLMTAPLFFALDENAELGSRIAQFPLDDGNLDEIIHMVRSTRALERSRALAASYAEKARAALSSFPTSPAKSALQGLTFSIVGQGP
ncbi:hypothetical protein EW146_g7935 [Bondarzewia mesenterica]|uniref:(2E,6E)-farnesyl diphosphate synthase n=1 Tax=Bondarzewia mesenterica TaxID=1095465 RepID=A0A4S4LIA4_9AGAM|nr:hypothetical protein EW146_g7935 [Bondarzewia mesenterica]